MSSKNDDKLPQLDDYRLLGASGLRVSPMCLGAMTFGTEWGAGTDFEGSKKLFDLYVEKGGNFIDTASIYTEGSSERFLGELVAPMRSQIVVATKYSSNPPPFPSLPLQARHKNPNFGGNQRKALVENLDTSLKRMKLDYVDLLYVHVWDFRTPVEETIRALDDVVRSGKALYVAVSDTPAWVVSSANTIAQLRGWSPYIALQTRYNLLDRSLEWELGPMAHAHGLGVVPWGSIAEGFLSGKHKRDQLSADSKRGTWVARHIKNEKNWKILDEVLAISSEVNRTPAQVALNWISQKPGIASPLVGARTVDQLKENLEALDFKLTAEQMQRLDEVSSTPIEQQPFPKAFTQVDYSLGACKIEKRFQ
jgi:aryl-alcohol dehydrogenase-like predicted oxidoreductase